MFPALSTRSKPLALPILWERTGCWPVKTTRATISDAMRPIYSSSCPNNREAERPKWRSQKGQVFRTAAEGLGKFKVCWRITRQLLSALPLSDGLIVLNGRHPVCGHCEFLAASVAAQLMSATDFPNVFTLETAGWFRLHRCSQACVEPSGRGEHGLP